MSIASRLDLSAEVHSSRPDFRLRLKDVLSVTQILNKIVSIITFMETFYMNSKIALQTLATALVSSFLLCSQAIAAGVLPSTPARLEAGKALYAKNCMACHGEKGDGNGPAGKMMKPKPRDFREAKFVNGDKPENIFKTIAEGLPGTAMAPFKALSEEDRSALAHYVLSLKGAK